MAQEVEPKKNDDRWKWVVGILAAIIIIWIIIEATETDDAVDDMDDMETTTTQNTVTFNLELETDYTIS